MLNLNIAYKIIIGIIACIFVIACKKNDSHKPIDPDNNISEEFKLISYKRNTYDASVQVDWTNFKSISVDTSLSYSIKVDGKIIVSGLKKTSYSVPEIFVSNTYHNTIVASIKNGPCDSITFTIPEEKELIYSDIERTSQENYFACHSVNGYKGWKLDIGPCGPAIISNDTLFIEGRTDLFERGLYAINRKTGKIIWKTPATKLTSFETDMLVHDKGLIYYNSLQCKNWTSALGKKNKFYYYPAFYT